MTLLLMLLTAFATYGALRLVNWTFDVPGFWRKDKQPLRLGFSHDIVRDNDTGSWRYENTPEDNRYLERWLVWLPWGTLRLHRFWKGDDVTAYHDHPWWFITFPFTTYYETVWDIATGTSQMREVKAWRFHYRPAEYRHIVRKLDSDKPIYTFVISGQRARRWGFWPEPNKFVYWREWLTRPRVAGDQP